MNTALKLFIGEHDFKGFASSIEEKENTILTINNAYAKKLMMKYIFALLEKFFALPSTLYGWYCFRIFFGRCSLKDIEDRLNRGFYLERGLKHQQKVYT